MGTELPAGTRGRLGVRVLGTAAIAEVRLVRPQGETVLLGPSSDNAVQATAEVTPEPTRSWEFFYVQVTQADGELAWSSPIWVG